MKITKEWLFYDKAKEYFAKITKEDDAVIELSELLDLLKVADKFEVEIDFNGFDDILADIMLACEVSNERYAKLLCRLAAGNTHLITDRYFADWLLEPNMVGWFDNPAEETHNQKSKVNSLARREIDKLRDPELAPSTLRYVFELFDQVLRSPNYDNEFTFLLNHVVYEPNTRKVLHGALVEFFDGLELTK
ncbi:hypothetical protein SIPHO049v1_p0004 [Vibrio phage PS14A.1]|nr:hypothetical protein SIPHO049v1_p0004 [Vibrio phage PS14A.1]